MWLNRDAVPIPDHHTVMARRLSIVAGLGFFGHLYGLYALAIWPTVLGGAFVYLGKMWFLDRMVWLYEDMKDSDPRYGAWSY